MSDLQTDTDSLTDADIAERMRMDEEYIAEMWASEQDARDRGRWLIG